VTTDTSLSLHARVLAAIRRPAPLGEAEFNELALALYAFQRRENAPYGQYCAHLGAPESPGHWSEIPAVPASAFRHAALRSFPEEETAAAFRTSGTTGEGFGTHFFRSLELYEAALLRGWEALALPKLPQVLLIARPEDAPHSSLSHMAGTLGRLAPQRYCLDGAGQLDLHAFRSAVASGPVLVFGTALAFLFLFETLGEERLLLAPGSVAVETGGYKGSGRTLTKEALYGRFKDSLGLEPDTVFNEYGMTELSSQWYTHGLGRPHHGPTWTRFLVIDPATNAPLPEGGTGCLRLFDLANAGSVIALQTQDLAIRRGEGFELLGRDPAALPRGCSRAADELLRS